MPKRLSFAGLIPRLAGRLLPETAATVATNCDLQRGRLEPRKEFGASVGVGDTAIYNDAGTWRAWSADVDVVASPIHGSTKIYYTGDGVPKVRDGATEYPLGIPVPAAALTATAQAKASSGFTLTWHWFYEELDGTRVDVDLSAIAPSETVVGSEYTLAAIPAKVSASADAQFIMWAEVSDADGAYLGQVIPTPAISAGNTDMVFAGSKVTGSLVVGATAVLTLAYDTSRASDYEVTRNYVYTYVRTWADGQTDEGPPSAASADVAVSPAQDCALSAFTAPPAGYGISHLWIYRTVTHDSGTEYYFVDEIAIATPTYLDEKADKTIALSENLLESTDWDGPPSDLAGLRVHPGGFAVGFSGKSVYLSAPYQLHAWPHRLTTRDTVVALGIVESSIVVATTGVPVVYTGSEPEAMMPEDVPLKQACSAKRSLVETKKLVGWASPDGFVVVGAGTAQLITERHYTREQWQALSPASMLCAWHDNQLIIFHAGGCKILRLGSEGAELTATADTADGVYEDLATDTLYVARAGGIYPWGGGANRTLTWRGRIDAYPRPVSMAVARVVADSHPVTLKVYDGADNLLCTVTTVNDDAFWLPELPAHKEWQLEVSGATGIDEALIATGMDGLA